MHTHSVQEKWKATQKAKLFVSFNKNKNKKFDYYSKFVETTFKVIQ